MSETLKQAIITFLQVYKLPQNQIASTDIIELYYAELRQYQEIDILRSMRALIVSWCPKYGQKLPSIADILRPLLQSKMDTAYEVYAKTIHKTGIRPDWVVHAHRILGETSTREKFYDYYKTYILTGIKKYESETKTAVFADEIILDESKLISSEKMRELKCELNKIWGIN